MKLVKLTTKLGTNEVQPIMVGAANFVYTPWPDNRTAFWFAKVTVEPDLIVEEDFTKVSNIITEGVTVS